jgi:F-type H+-transporting ATPase subunit delta
MAEISTIARPYAEAIFQLAHESSQLKPWSDMLQYAAAVAADADMQDIIGNANVTKEQLTGLFIDICGKKLNKEGQNMIKLLVENHRLGVLPEISMQFETLKAEAEKTIEAEVIAAYEVSAAQQKKIVDNLKKRLGREVTLTCRVDKTLLGGAIIKAGDMVIDGSTQGQIQKLALELAS